MIKNEETLKYILDYFNNIKNNLPTNSVFKYAYKYNKDSNTDDEPMCSTDNIVVYYESGSDSKNNSFKISFSTITTYLRNKKLDELGI